MLERISNKFSQITREIAGKARINEKNVRDAVDEIKLALLEADVHVRVVRRFVNRTLEEATGEQVLNAVQPGQQFVKIVHDRLVQLLGDARQDLELKGPDTVSVMLLVGLQGSGKTTTAAKLALRLRQEDRRPLLVAADLVRPAAVEQLVTLGQQLGVPVYHEQGARDPLKVVKAALKAAEKQQYNAVIVDTAGRLQVDEALMDEIAALSELCEPQETLLVADSMGGQSAVEVAKAFNERISLSGAILSKFDSDARGGAAFSLKTVTGVPIKFIGTGEKLGELEPFFPERIASRILGMGDVVSLVEKAQETINEQDALDLQEKLRSEQFTLQDYLEQFARLRKMGPVSSVLEMIPGMQGQIDPEAIDEKAVQREEAIIQSMTYEERMNHRIIGPSRRKRIARGSGSSVYEVNRLLKRFDKMRSMMRKATRNKKYQHAMMSQMQKG